MKNTTSTLSLKVLDCVALDQDAKPQQFFALRLSLPKKWHNWQAGQFIMLRPDNFGLELTWARPFSICQVTEDYILIVFKVTGKGTQRIAHLAPNDIVQIWGPLGNGFAVEEETKILLLGAGMGIIPLIAYANKHPNTENLSLVFGHTEPIQYYPLHLLPASVQKETFYDHNPEDLGNFIALLAERIQICAEGNHLVLACGPRPFLTTIYRFAMRYNARVQLSLEKRMACGVGACLGCVTRTSPQCPDETIRDRPVQICRHGPVFWADQIIL